MARWAHGVEGASGEQRGGRHGVSRGHGGQYHWAPREVSQGGTGSQGPAGTWRLLTSRELGTSPTKPKPGALRATPSVLLHSPWGSHSRQALTLIRQEVQHGLQQEGQVPDRKGGVAHPSGRVDQLVQQAHLDSGPAPVSTCNDSDSDRASRKCLQRARRPQEGRDEPFSEICSTQCVKLGDLKTNTPNIKLKAQQKYGPCVYIPKELLGDIFPHIKKCSRFSLQRYNLKNNPL